jgi:hypothetical protein
MVAVLGRPITRLLRSSVERTVQALQRQIRDKIEQQRRILESDLADPTVPDMSFVAAKIKGELAMLDQVERWIAIDPTIILADLVGAIESAMRRVEEKRAVDASGDSIPPAQEQYGRRR